MINSSDQYETVVGLEVHAQLLTKSKLFCADSTLSGHEPNTNISPVSLAHPGTLPVMNRKAIELAVKAGLACHCEIVQDNFFARKNYFYPDLPKGYQVSQHTAPVCRAGYISINTGDGEKNIRLNRIHLEEDAGKSIHDADAHYTCIDLNRAGVPLIEIVSEPDIRNGDEAYAYLTELRKLLRYLEVCDGNMEAGSLRCDANISVRKKGDDKLGVKVEVKNLNSIRNVKKAIEYESSRLVSMLEKGETIVQETRSFDANSGSTFALRDKEEAEDYRYFPEPDLTPFKISGEFIEEIRKRIPALQKERIKRYKQEFGLAAYDAAMITEDRAMADYFENTTLHTKEYKAIANWMMGPVKNWMNENNADISLFPVPPEKLAMLIRLVNENKISFSAASGKVLDRLIKNPLKEPMDIAREENLLQESDVNIITPVVDEVLSRFGEKVKEYRRGKKGLMALFVGEVMKRTNGKADPKMVNELLSEKLK